MLEWLHPILDFIRSLKFWTVVYDWEGAGVMRRGLFHRTLKPGLHWTIPVLETVWSTNILLKPTDIGPLPITTRDGHAVVASAIVTWRVLSVERFLTECEEPREALHDAASGTLAHAIMAHNWADIPNEPFIAAVCTAARKACRRYGIQVVSMRWTGVVECKPLVVWSVGTSAAPKAALLPGGEVE